MPTFKTKVQLNPRTRAWAALHYIEENPDQWDQDSWYACLAGFVDRQNGGDGLGFTGMRAAQLLLLSDRRAAKLFSHKNDIHRLRKLVRRYFGPDPFSS